MAHTGSCLCGQARYTITAEPLAARMCWCRVCQTIASGSATVNVLFPVDHVQFVGEIAVMEKMADSGTRLERGFCPKCGTQIFTRTIGAAHLPIRIRAGTLENPDLMAPQSIIWTASAPSWARFDPDLPQYPAGAPAPPATPKS